jgi:hypothetical protein
MITTTKGLMDESLLQRREGIDEDDRARSEWIEYWDGAELVHRSVHIAIKQGIEMNIEQGQLNG